jgi:hypothetical protein
MLVRFVSDDVTPGRMLAVVAAAGMAAAVGNILVVYTSDVMTAGSMLTVVAAAGGLAGWLGGCKSTDPAREGSSAALDGWATQRLLLEVLHCVLCRVKW